MNGGQYVRRIGALLAAFTQKLVRSKAFEKLLEQQQFGFAFDQSGAELAS